MISYLVEDFKKKGSLQQRPFENSRSQLFKTPVSHSIKSGFVAIDLDASSDVKHHKAL